MKTNATSFLILFVLITVAFIPARADFINSTYIGPTDGNWGDPANWSPAIVPNNGGGNTFAATIANVFLTLDLDVTVNLLTFNPGDGDPIILGGTAPLLYSLDHNFTSAHTSVGNGGILLASAVVKDVTVDLGELADFSGTTLNTGYDYAVTAEPGRAATMKFNGANIVTSTAGIVLGGVNTSLTDENGADALAHFQNNAFDGYFDLEVGRNFTTEGAFVNAGLIAVFASDPGFVSGDIDTTLTINGSYTGIGYPLDPNTDGQVELLAPGPDGDARMIINGALTNYNTARKTLNKTWYQWEAANGRSATTQVLGGRRPLDIVTNNASLSLFGPNTGFRDTAGNDALRNLAVSARFLMGDRDFTTAHSFTSTSRLSIYGNSHFNVNGHLSVSGEQFEVFALTGYALLGDPFPNDPPYKKSYITVRGSLDMRCVDSFRYGIFDNATLPSVTINGAAKLGGALVPYLLDGTNVSASDRFTLMTAANMVGHFSNVANGGRVPANSSSDGSVLGTFLLTINRRSISYRTGAYNLQIGIARRALGEKEKALAAFTASEEGFRGWLRRYPEEAAALGRLPLALAGQGRRDDALREIENAIAIFPLTRDPLSAVEIRDYVANAYSWTGDRTLALELLQKIVALPGGPTAGDLKLNPRWDDLREDPRLNDLVAEAAKPISL